MKNSNGSSVGVQQNIQEWFHDKLGGLIAEYLPPFGCAVLLIVLACFFCWLFYYGLPVPWFVNFFGEPHGKDDLSVSERIAQQLALAALGFVGGFIALHQFNRTHQQKEDQFTEAEKAKQEQFEIAEQEKQFVDIQNRIAEKNSETIRANAATRLAHFAQTPVIGRKSEVSFNKCLADYPFFDRSVALLATALLLEENGRVRDTALAAIDTLVQFAKPNMAEQKGKNGELLHKMVDLLVPVNRSARDSFCRALAEYSILTNIPVLTFTDDKSTGVQSIEPSHPRFDLLLTMAKLADNPLGNKHILCSLMRHPEYTKRRTTYTETARTIAGKEKRSSTITDRLAMFDIAVSRLIGTRDALAMVLRNCISPVEEIPSLPQRQIEGRTLSVEEWSDEIDKWRNWRESPLQLENVFLGGANLKNVQLSCAQLQNAQLSGANLEGAKLQGALMKEAELAIASLSHAELMGALLEGAYLPGCDVREAKLNGADLRLADFSNGDLQKTELYGAILNYIQLSGADLRGAKLAHTFLKGAKLHNATVDDKTDFTDSNWREANWNVSQNMNDDIKQRTADLRAELESRYPQP